MVPGSFHRRIVVVTQSFNADGGEARAALEDDYHHFRVAVQHAGARVLAVDGQALRHPYGLCPSAVEPLQQLRGMRLDTVASAVNRVTDASLQCTHLLDLAGLAIAAAASGPRRRQYDIAVPDRVDGRTTAALRRDGEPLFAWQLDVFTIAGPAPFAGVSLLHGLARWALDHLNAADAEAAIVLRRGAVISVGRQLNLDLQIHAKPTGRCHVQQPGRAEQALRVVGSTWDFTGRADDLCADDAGWLAGADGAMPAAAR